MFEFRLDLPSCFVTLYITFTEALNVAHKYNRMKAQTLVRLDNIFNLMRIKKRGCEEGVGDMTKILYNVMSNFISR